MNVVCVLLQIIRTAVKIEHHFHKMNGEDGLITTSYRSFHSSPDRMEETSQEYTTLAL